MASRDVNPVIEDVKQASDAVCEAVVSAAAAVQNAWDNLDPGLKQWIVMGLSIAATIAMPGIGGILVSCVLDGTFTDMLKAISTGDWAMLALSCAAFVPGMKQAKTGFKLLSHADDIGKAAKKSDRLVVRLFGGKSGPLSKDSAGGGWMKAKDFVKSFAEGGPRHTFGIGGWNKGSKLEIGVLRGDRQVGTAIARSADELPGGGVEVLAKEGDFAFRGWLPFCWPPGLP